MTDPIIFESTTPRFGLPLLFTAQAQKEFFINEAHVLTDALSHSVILGSASGPVSTAKAGECWIVDANAIGAFEGHEDNLALFHDGQWLFVPPAPGMCVFDRSLGQRRFYDDGWKIVTDMSGPSGGTTLDNEARNAILAIIEALRIAGIVPRG